MWWSSRCAWVRIRTFSALKLLMQNVAKHSQEPNSGSRLKAQGSKPKDLIEMQDPVDPGPACFPF